MTNQGIRFYAIPNGGKRNLMEAIKFKRMGTMSGVPDLCIPIPSGSYHGLYLELKRVKGGKVSENQKYWLEFLREKGYQAFVANGFEEAKEIILYYLSLTKPAA
ncbi:MAG: VRR-NUC domain-containing protein [Nitrososphaerales archaeon]